MHHEALQRVDFLLRHDELAACESPSLPECILAMRRTKIQKRLQQQQQHMGPGAGAKDAAPLPPLQEQDNEELQDDPSVEGDPEGPNANSIDSSSVPDVTDPASSHKDLSKEVLARIQAERKQLVEFLRRMNKGMQMTMLPQDDGKPKDVLLLMPRGEEQVFSLEVPGAKPEVIPLARVSCIHIGCRDGVFEANGKDHSMGMVMTVNSSSPGDAAAGHSAARTYHFSFVSVSDADEFKRGMKRLRDQDILKGAADASL